MKKFLMLLCAVTFIFGVVGTASALSFKTKHAKQNVWFDSDHKVDSWKFNLDKLKKIDPEDTIKKAYFSISFTNEKGKKDDFKIKLDGSPGSDGDEITALVTDHKLIVKVKRKGGKFKVNWVKLNGEVWKNPSTAPVPEPATILLMGIGLLGLVGYSRKRFSKKS